MNKNLVRFIICILLITSVILSYYWFSENRKQHQSWGGFTNSFYCQLLMTSEQIHEYREYPQDHLLRSLNEHLNELNTLYSNACDYLPWRITSSRVSFGSITNNIDELRKDRKALMEFLRIEERVINRLIANLSDIQPTSDIREGMSVSEFNKEMKWYFDEYLVEFGLK